MNSRIPAAREPKLLFLFALLACLELAAAGVVTLLIAPDPRNAFLLGFSLQRVVLVAGIFLLSIMMLVAGVLANRKKVSFDAAWLSGRKAFLRRGVYALSFLLILWGWASLFCPPYFFGRLNYIFERLRPVSIAVGLSMAQFWLLYLYARGRLAFGAPLKASLGRVYRPILAFAVVMIVMGILVAVTRFGLVGDLAFWNVPGMPLSSLQLSLLLLPVGALVVIWSNGNRDHPVWRFVKKSRLVPICIYIAAVLVWGLTPMLKHFFSLEPMPPAFQPYPYSDARAHDLGGISVMKGYGIYFYGYTDKPLYMVILGILHSIAGYDYVLMSWLQILILGLIPVVLFRLGEQYHSTPLGLLLAGILILRQRNAIVLSYQISSVNPRLLVTEEMTLLGVALTAYLLFLWIRTPKNWLALLCGACIGAASLIRLNPLFLFPAAAGLVLVAFWKLGRKVWFKQLVFFTIGFLIVFLPWVVTGVNQQGEPWLLVKLKDVIQSRYGYVVPAPMASTSAPFVGEASGAIIVDNGKMIPEMKSAAPAPFDGGREDEGTVLRFFDHLLHNFSTSLLSMPDSLPYEDIHHLGQRIYWSDANEWDGRLPATQTAFVILNILLLATGMGYGWVRYRWAGIAPLVVYLAYAVSLSSAMNSGGRYLVPMDWILYFYYALALILIINFACRVMVGRGLPVPEAPGVLQMGSIAEKRRLRFAFAGVIILASLIPLANLVLPIFTGEPVLPADVEAARQEIAARENLDVSYGEVLYPYYHDDTNMSFELMMPGGFASFMFRRDPALSTELTGGEQALVAWQSDDGVTLQVGAIYLWQNGEAVLIWDGQP